MQLVELLNLDAYGEALNTCIHWLATVRQREPTHVLIFRLYISAEV